MCVASYLAGRLLAASGTGPHDMWAAGNLRAPYDFSDQLLMLNWSGSKWRHVTLSSEIGPMLVRDAQSQSKSVQSSLGAECFLVQAYPGDSGELAWS